MSWCVILFYYLGKTSESDKKKPGKEWPIDKITHEIKDYLPLLHKQRKIEDPALIQQENLKTLRRLLKKLWVINVVVLLKAPETLLQFAGKWHLLIYLKQKC